MLFVLTDMTALRYHRLARAGLVPKPQPCHVCSLAEAGASLKKADPTDFLWRHITPPLLAAQGIIARAAVEPGLAVAARNKCVPGRDFLYDLERPPSDDGDLRIQVLRNLVRWSRSALAKYDPAASQGRGALDDLLGYDFPRLDLLVGEKSGKRKSNNVIPHTWQGDLPVGSLLRCNASVLVISPELLLVRLSILHPGAPHLLTALGLEFAGRYALLPEGYADCGKCIDEGKELVSADGRLLGDGYVRAKEALDIDRLKDFFGRANVIRGRHARETALPWIRNGSESPFESASNVSLVLPRTSGGFSVGTPELNAKVSLSAEACALNNGVRSCRLDELFIGRSGQKVAVEPGGDLWHRGLAWKRDNGRRQALEHDGYTVVAVSWDEFVDFGRWRVIAEDVAARLDRGLGPVSSRMRERQAAVHVDLCNTDLLRETFG